MAISRSLKVFGTPYLEELGGLDTSGLPTKFETWLGGMDSLNPSIISKIKGDFSFGINLPNGSTFLAVDRFAIRTICYCVEGLKLRYAGRADELVNINPEIDPQAIFDYLYFHVIPSPRTIYKGVFRLPPGHYALFEKGVLTVAPYWKPTFIEAHGVSFDALKIEFKNLLQAAVSSELDQGKPGCFLSGGTDSSTISGMMAKVANLNGISASTYSIGFDALGYDEMEFARVAAKHFQTEHHEYYVTPDDLVNSMGLVAAHYDQPFGNSSALPAYYCAKMARENGVTKILAGDGGDELFGGNTRYSKQKIFDWYNILPEPLRIGFFEPFASLSIMSKVPGIKKGASYVNQAKVPMPDRLMTYNLLFRLGLNQVLTPAFLSQINAEEPSSHQRRVWSETQSDASLVNKMLAYDWRYTLADCDLPKVVGTTALAGLEVGFPMLDSRLLDFSERLPTAYKLKGFKLRWFFKEALRGFLPDEIITKKKQGFGLPFGVWATQHRGLFALAENALRSLADRGVVRSDFVSTLLKNRLPEHPGYYGEMVWILTMLELWLNSKSPMYRVGK
jgi:asparagine synthase (glutamine-hydrolysing)